MTHWIRFKFQNQLLCQEILDDVEDSNLAKETGAENTRKQNVFDGFTLQIWFYFSLFQLL